jgi:ParB-like nuclease family protein
MKCKDFKAELPFHPAANMFDLMKGAEFKELVGDIQRRGLRVPITAHKGSVIDGRNRALACARAGVEPRYQEFDGSEEDVARFIVSMNRSAA